MRHTPDGTIRRLVDEPAGVGDADRRHVAGCTRCRSVLADARADAIAIAHALEPVHAGGGHAGGGHAGVGHGEAGATAAEVDAAWSRLSGRLAEPGIVAAPPSARPRARGPQRLRRPVVAAAAAAILLTGASAAAAADWLPIFHTERVAPVALSERDLISLPDLSAYGTLAVSGTPQPHDVASAAAARAATGLSVPGIARLPHGVSGMPTFQTGGQLSATFTFSAAKAAAAAAAGHQVPPVPAGLDGSQFRLTAGPGVAELWRDARGVPALVVGRAVAPAVASSGVPFATVRDYLLSLPGLPDTLAAQLRSYSGDGTTLPLPLPTGLGTTTTADVDGAAATVISSRDGTLHAVVWVHDGEVLAVAGSLSTDEVLGVARSLRLAP